MKKKIKYILVALISVLLLGTLSNDVNKYDEIYYQEYIINLKNEYNSDYPKLIDIVKSKLNSKKLSNYERAINLLARETYLFFDGNYEEVKNNFYETEKFLSDKNMHDELIYLYSIMNNIAMKEYEYEHAYIYIYKSELLSTILYNEKKDQEQLSTLLSIKYLKSYMAIDIGLEDEAKRAFEDAEKLRKDYYGRKRGDMYGSITRYYYKLGNYEKAKEYALETIHINGDFKQYQLDSLAMKIILGEAYLFLGELDKAIEIAKELENFNIDTDNILKNKLILYSDIYEHYGNEEKAISNLKEAYILAMKNKDFIEQDRILNKIISLTKQINNEKDLLYWYDEHLNLHIKQKELKNNQFLIGKIIDTEIVNSNANLKIVELEKKNLLYTDFILMILLAIIIFFIIKLMYLNRHDSLTHIYNRGYFNKLYKKYNNSNERYSLIIFDIDNFKKLNDTYGHDFGDIVLINISKCIKNMINKDCKLFRYGGEEFVVLIKNKDVNYALELAESIRERVYVMSWKENTTVTISMGISYSGDDTKDMIKRADNNLYESKMNGKNRLTYK
ncbi:diguanylate cyclase [Paraclostridium dentum]|uniref:diguanylate cyclase n=1 Tax=Paraclostridium dentum TaxID=2662455 RepID=UPI003F340D8A